MGGGSPHASSCGALTLSFFILLVLQKTRTYTPMQKPHDIPNQLSNSRSGGFTFYHIYHAELSDSNRLAKEEPNRLSWSFDVISSKKKIEFSITLY